VKQLRLKTMTHIMLCGCGKMGQALLRGWIKHLSDIGINAITIIEPNLAEMADLPDHPLITYWDSPDKADSQQTPDMIVLASKPQDMAEAIAGVKPLAGAQTAWLSIAAGISINWLSEHLNGHHQIIRTMPNTPSALGMGVTAMAYHAMLTAQNQTLAFDLMASVGEVVEVGENLMDAVTAVSGSGPAYIFLMQEAMEAAAIKMGLSEDVARKLSVSTIRGAGELMRVSQEKPAQLRQNVSSRGGTTLAALEVMMTNGRMADMMEEAMLAARNRSKELGQ
jgi:pyrroline-5-carboxylate reductase